MQAAAPELIDLSRRDAGRRSTCTASTATEPPIKAAAAAGRGSTTTFATNCLLARRLVERGVRFVNLYHASWDHHSNLDAELAFNCRHGRPAGRRADQGPEAARPARRDAGGLGCRSSAARRWARTAGGSRRDRPRPPPVRVHASGWPAAASRAARCIGKTDEIGWNVVEDPVHVNDLHATILHLFGLDHLKLTYRFQGLDQRLTTVTREARVVHELLE